MNSKHSSITLAVFVSCVVAFLTPPNVALAHGDVHEQIEQVSELIKKNPKNAELYFKRAELHRIHEDWKAAEADYDEALRLNPELIVVECARGKMFLEAGKFDSAKTVLDGFLAKQPDHYEARLTRARVFSKLNQLKESAADYTAIIAQSPRPEPELYLERAQTLASGGTEFREEALRGLDEGIKILGPLVTLELSAIELELLLKRYDSALERLHKISEQTPRKETWLARRGEILKQAGRADEAQQAFLATLKSIEALPERQRKTKATAQLEASIRAVLGKPLTK